MTADITDTARPVDARAVMGLLPGRPRVLALGEPTHGEDALLDLRNALFRQLVEQEGYRTIAIESDCLKGLLVDDHVTSGAGSLDDVMEHGFSHGFGASAANRELVRWMRAHNDGRPASEQLRFAGVDGPLEISGAASPRQALTALHGYLAAHGDEGLLPCSPSTLDDLLGTDDRWTNPAVMWEPAESVGRSAEARELRLIADDLVSLLDEQTPHLLAATSRDRVGAGTPPRPHRRRPAALPPLDGRHLAEPDAAAARRAGPDDGRQRPRRRRARARRWSSPTTPTCSGRRARCGWATCPSRGGAPARS